MRYNIGNKVLIKDIDWYNKNKNNRGDVLVAYKLFSHGVYTREHAIFTKNMVKYCGQTLTISEYSNMGYKMQECIDSGEDFHIWTDEMIEKRVEESLSEDFNIEEDENEDIIENCVYRIENGCQILFPKGYEFADDNGKIIESSIIFLEKKKQNTQKLMTSVALYNRISNIRYFWAEKVNC